ncbi:MAG: hypothetical protein U0802_24155 [Candidatus Binatia bacterium]
MTLGGNGGEGMSCRLGVTSGAQPVADRSWRVYGGDMLASVGNTPVARRALSVSPPKWSRHHVEPRTESRAVDGGQILSSDRRPWRACLAAARDTHAPTGHGGMNVVSAPSAISVLMLAALARRSGLHRRRRAAAPVPRRAGQAAPTCAAAGLPDQATSTFAGSDGSTANCFEVLEALGAPPIGGAVSPIPCDSEVASAAARGRPATDSDPLPATDDR